MQGGDNFLSVSSVSNSACGVHVVRVSNCFARDAARSAHMGVEGGGSRRGVKIGGGGGGRGGGSSLLKGETDHPFQCNPARGRGRDPASGDCDAGDCQGNTSVTIPHPAAEGAGS